MRRERSPPAPGFDRLVPKAITGEVLEALLNESPPTISEGRGRDGPASFTRTVEHLLAIEESTSVR